MSKYQPKTHIRDEQFQDRSLCGQPWRGKPAAGRPCSSTDPPYLVNDETSSVSLANCATCVKMFREKMLKPTAT